jgi:hypothetical protein
MNERLSLLIYDKIRKAEQPHFSLFLDYFTFAEKEKEKYQLGRTKLLYKKTTVTFTKSLLQTLVHNSHTKKIMLFYLVQKIHYHFYLKFTLQQPRTV